MSRSTHRIVKNFPGYISYCACIERCSRWEIDHLIPIKLQKDQLDHKTFVKARNNMHNLYPCCFKINNYKSYKILGLGYYNPRHNSYLARSALYMEQKYNLTVSSYIQNNWKKMSLHEKPHPFEHERNVIISSFQGNENPFISNYPNIVNQHT